MQANDWERLLVAATTGFVCGLVFFGGLWWTLRQAVKATSPAFWILGSFLVRTGMVVLGIGLATRGYLPAILVALAAFIVARFLVIRIT